MTGSRSSHGLLRGVFACALALACVTPARVAHALSDPWIEEAPAAMVCDQAGNELWSRNAEEELAPASITKVMTAMVALDSGYGLDDRCFITEHEFSLGAQLAGYVATDTPTMRELLQATLIYSGNDAALNVAINVAGSEEAFVNLMNQKTQELGMTHTHWANPHGLEEEGHYTCVRDLVIMGRYAMEHYPFIAETVHMRGVELLINGSYLWLESTDDLMETYEGLLGIKTGAVESGYTFLGASQRSGVSLYTAVLGCDTDEGRFADTAALMDWGYENFAGRTFGREGWVVRMAPYALGFAARTQVTLPSDQVAHSWPTGSITYRTISVSPDVALDRAMPFGAIWWRQSGRLCGASLTHVDETLTQAPALNILSQPLFSDQTGA